MFYEEKMIDGVLHWRGTPTGDWQPVSPRELAEKIDILRTRLAESEARAVAAEANDRRYRWLRDPANNESVSNLIAIYDYGDEALLMDGDDLDAAIDAAMKQETEREAGSA